VKIVDVAVKLHPEKRQVIRQVEQLGALVVRESDQALRQLNLVGQRRVKVGREEFWQDFHFGKI
jgi:hypothetical protein